jgi:hypothetical protein
MKRLRIAKKLANFGGISSIIEDLHGSEKLTHPRNKWIVTIVTLFLSTC